MGFFEWMMFFGVWCAVFDVGRANRKLDALKDERDKLRSDVDGLMAQTWRIEERR